MMNPFSRMTLHSRSNSSKIHGTSEKGDKFPPFCTWSPLGTLSSLMILGTGVARKRKRTKMYSHSFSFPSPREGPFVHCSFMVAVIAINAKQAHICSLKRRDGWTIIDPASWMGGSARGESDGKLFMFVCERRNFSEQNAVPARRKTWRTVNTFWMASSIVRLKYLYLLWWFGRSDLWLFLTFLGFCYFLPALMKVWQLEIQSSFMKVVKNVLFLRFNQKQTRFGVIRTDSNGKHVMII